MRLSPVVVHGLLNALASLVAERGAPASEVAAHGLSCTVACRLFPEQRSNPCPLSWQARSYHWTTREVTSISIDRGNQKPLSVTVRVSFVGIQSKTFVRLM